MITKVLAACGLTALENVEINEAEFLKDVILKETDEHLEVDTYLVMSRYLDALLKSRQSQPSISFNHDISHQELVEKYHYDQSTGEFTNRRNGYKISTRKKSDDYIKIKINSIVYPAHRLAWFYVHKRWPSQFLDHIDHDKTNNAIANLREVTASENSQNKKPKMNPSGSMVGGVSFCNTVKKWRVVLVIQYKRHHIGYYKTQEEAEKVAIAKRREMYKCNTL